MTILRCIIILQLSAALTLGHLAQNSKPPSPSEQAEAMVQSLYTEVVARHPIGIPNDADTKIFGPHLSKSLLHKIDLAADCDKDWYRQNPDPNIKPEFVSLELGLFTGWMENVEPGIFHVLGTESGKNGSFRVYVELITIYGTPPKQDASVWRVAAIVIRENGRFVVDDIIFLKDHAADSHDIRLSEALSEGCKSPRWVGLHQKRNDLK